MIQRLLDQITEADLTQLLTNAVSESKTIDYKKELPGTTDGDKKEFLADASSFSNTIGGDLIIGIEENKGVPVGVTGCTIADPDAELNRLESILRDGLEPRIPVALRHIKLASGNSVLIIRASRSWVGPHRVTYKGHDKFYARHAAGKYPLDVTELRTAFNAAETVGRRIKGFRAERIAEIYANKTPVPMNADARIGGGKMVLHLLPLGSFSSDQQIDFLQYNRDAQRLRPMGSSGWSARINLNGVISYAGGLENSYSYLQLYRNGMIEAVHVPLFHMVGEKRMIPSLSYEKDLLDFLPRCLSTLRELEINPPVYLFLTLVGVQGSELGVDRTRFPFLRDKFSIDEDVLELPEVVVENYDVDPAALLRPVFDLVWNACGFERSLNFDDKGNWRG